MMDIPGWEEDGAGRLGRCATLFLSPAKLELGEAEDVLTSGVLTPGVLTPGVLTPGVLSPGV